jgi:aspartyl-tRNA(Asn)/glutamyl-tRNA(Gln) amidotransferase subunit A
MVPWALGSDTGGSVRQPASFCGVVGFKPTYGQVSRYGLIAMASSYDQIGPIAKTVEDAKIIFETIRGKDPKDNTTVERNLKKEVSADVLLKGIKIGVVNEFFEKKGLDEDVKKIIQQRINWAKEQGAELVEIELPHFKYSLAVYYLMQTAEISSNLARLDGIRFGFNEALEKNSKSENIIDAYKYSREEAFGDEVKRRIILGTYSLSAGYYDAYYKKAQAVREIIKRELREVFEKVDILVSPTAPTPAFKIGEKVDDPLQMYLADIYTVSANVAMIPAISIPAGTVKRDGKNLPVGIQLMGEWWKDKKLLEIAKAMEV